MNEAPTTDAGTSTSAALTDNPYLKEQVLGNELWRWGALLASVLVAYIIGKAIAFVLHHSAQTVEKKGHSLSASMLDAIAKTCGLFGLVIGLSAGQHFLILDTAATQAFSTATAVLFTLTFGLLCWRIVEGIASALLGGTKATGKSMNLMLVPILRTTLRTLILLLVVLQIVQLFSDRQLSSIIAGLGIGGLAFALAAQDSIKHIFGSIVIFADKPFAVGERVIVDGTDGTVEEVGMRSTRIRTLAGHLVTIPNGELANRNIENISKRPNIRRLLNVTITYDTPPEKVKRATEIIREILAVAPHEGGRTEGGNVQNPDLLPKVVFNEFNADSLNILVLYWYTPADYWDYMAYSEWFNFELLNRYNREGIEFAFPTQTLFLAGDSKRPLDIGLNKTGGLNLEGK